MLVEWSVTVLYLRGSRLLVADTTHQLVVLLYIRRTLASHSIKFQYRARKTKLDQDPGEVSAEEREKLNEITESIGK